MGLCRGMAHRAIMETAQPLWLDTWLGWWQTNETFGVIPSRTLVADCFRDDPATYFPVSFRYFELLEACGEQMQHPQHSRNPGET